MRDPAVSCAFVQGNSANTQNHERNGSFRIPAYRSHCSGPIPGQNRVIDGRMSRLEDALYFVLGVPGVGQAIRAHSATVSPHIETAEFQLTGIAIDTAHRADSGL